MQLHFEDRLSALDRATLTPLVRQILTNAAAEVLDWQIQPLSNGGLGIYRFAGRARLGNETAPWAMVLKALAPQPEQEPSHWAYWKREPLAYTSGVLLDLPCGVVAPRCFAVVEEEDVCWCWIEDVGDENTPRWTLEQYRRAARCLGRFNGAYLTGRPLPQKPWFGQARERTWLQMSEPVFQDLERWTDHPFAQSWLSPESQQRIKQFWHRREQHLAALDRLPQTLCHHDAYGPNLRLRQDNMGEDSLFAFDWQFMGTGVVGEEIAHLVWLGLMCNNFDPDQAKALDAAVFEGYLVGLRAAGWQGDERIVRYGYAAAASRVNGLGIIGIGLPMTSDQNIYPRLEHVFRQPVADIFSSWSRFWPDLLDLGDEAERILAELS
jgi:hypothetical protein